MPLICWEIVELHRSNRVMRQFGLIQSIPQPVPPTLLQLHDVQMRGHTGVDWHSRHRDYIEE